MPKIAAYERVVLSTYCAIAHGQQSCVLLKKMGKKETHVEEIADSEKREDSNIQLSLQSFLFFLVNRLVYRISRQSFHVECRIALVNYRLVLGIDLSLAHILDSGDFRRILVLVVHSESDGSCSLSTISLEGEQGLGTQRDLINTRCQAAILADLAYGGK